MRRNGTLCAEHRDQRCGETGHFVRRMWASDAEKWGIRCEKGEHFIVIAPTPLPLISTSCWFVMRKRQERCEESEHFLCLSGEDFHCQGFQQALNSPPGRWILPCREEENIQHVAKANATRCKGQRDTLHRPLPHVVFLSTSGTRTPRRR